MGRAGIVTWTDTAWKSLADIEAHIARNAPEATQGVLRHITGAVASPAFFPEAGRIVPEIQRADVREVFVFQYRVIYRVLPDRIEILNILHGARLLDVEKLLPRKKRRPPRA